MPPKTSPSPPPQERGELNVDLLVDKLRHMSHLSTITENRYLCDFIYFLFYEYDLTFMEKIYYFFSICEYDFLQSHIFSVPTQLTWDLEEIHITHQPKVILQKKKKKMISMFVYIGDFFLYFFRVIQFY